MKALSLCLPPADYIVISIDNEVRTGLKACSIRFLLQKHNNVTACRLPYELSAPVGCIALAGAFARGAEPGPEKNVPFWQLPKANLDLRSLSPADVSLMTGPDTQRGLNLLQGGDVAPVADFVPGDPELQPFVPAQDSGYKVVQKGLNIGAVPYGDRGYKIEKLPPVFAGLTLLQTKVGHKAVADVTYSIIVSASKPCLVFVALDQRVFPIYANNGAPGWLNEYAPTGEKIKTDDPFMARAGAEFEVFVRKSAGGRIVLGSPSMDTSSNSMYFVFFGEPKTNAQ